ncbi:hypothetical protein KKF34_09835 [Myxococcota bacterium]|nr:hypothetical protein [Myxococcota bacterium]MBU1381086.1 hypothetical protein [Myxococcota bacterium]MBU1497165.1 hypothetical protein [Myxococcota bacterium]
MNRPFIIITLLTFLFSCSNNNNNTGTEKCTKGIPVSGDQSLFNSRIEITDINITPPHQCDIKKENEHLIGVQYTKGALPFDNEPKSGCKSPDANCSSVNVTEYLKAASVVAQQKGIQVTGVGIVSCGDDFSDGKDYFRNSKKVIRIKDWKYAEQMVRILSDSLKSWNLKATVYVHIAPIGPVCPLER